MLANKSDDRSYAEHNQEPIADVNRTTDYLSLLIEQPSVAKSFPLSPDHQSRNPRVTGGEVSRPYETLSDVATFGQMLGFGSTGQKASVSRGSRCCPSPNDPLVSLKAERVFSINSGDRAPIQSCLSKNIVDCHTIVGNGNAGIPKQQPGDITKPYVNPNLNQQNAERVGSQGKDSKNRKGYPCNGHDPAGSRVQGSRVHAHSLPHKSKLEGACY